VWSCNIPVNSNHFPVHYSFDYAQQVHYWITFSLNSGIMYKEWILAIVWGEIKIVPYYLDVHVSLHAEVSKWFSSVSQFVFYCPYMKLDQLVSRGITISTSVLLNLELLVCWFNLIVPSDWLYHCHMSDSGTLKIHLAIFPDKLSLALYHFFLPRTSSRNSIFASLSSIAIPGIVTFFISISQYSCLLPHPPFPNHNMHFLLTS